MIPDEYERPEWANDAIGARWWEFNLANPAVLSRLISLCTCHRNRERERQRRLRGVNRG